MEVVKYMQEYDENMDKRLTDYVKKWLFRLNFFKKYHGNIILVT